MREKKKFPALPLRLKPEVLETINEISPNFTVLVRGISQIMSTLINVINNGNSEMRKSELLEFFRFHNRKLLKFGIF